MSTRYKRELDGGTRPPLRLIATGDAPASCPMTLCISNIIWPAENNLDDEQSIFPSGTELSKLPEIELTDGWYRLRAEIDVTLANAIRRRKLRVGRKISLTGARVCVLVSLSILRIDIE